MQTTKRNKMLMPWIILAYNANRSFTLKFFFFNLNILTNAPTLMLICF